jgi:hypothetical protein
MKSLLCLLLAASFTIACTAEPLLTFKISKPLCLLSFLETASGDAHTSVTLREFIRTHTAAEDTADFRRLIARFSSMNYEGSYTLSQYPALRQKPRTSTNLVKIAAIQSGDLNEFFSRITGLMPNEQLLLFKEVLRDAEYYYDKAIFVQYKPALESQLAELQSKKHKTKAAFFKLKTFYGSTWPEEMPFTVAIYPIPGSSGNTVASPHNNSLVLAVLTDEKDIESRVSVAMHEICHVLYEEQPLWLQWRLDSVFAENSSMAKQYAYSYLDEALATACGNGWMYEYITGDPDKGAWYNDDYINTYAHALYPMVKGYIENYKTIDRRFIREAITVFEKQFPEAAFEYNNLLNKVNLYTDADSHQDFILQMNTLQSRYRVTHCNSSYPINDERSLSLAAESEGTQLFLVHSRQKENFEALRKIFPQLSSVDEKKEAITGFIDSKGRAVIVVNVHGTDRLATAFQKMAEAKKISQSLSSVSVN